MKLTPYFAGSIGFYLLLMAIFGSDPKPPSPTVTTTRSAVVTVALDPVQEAQQVAELLATTTTSSSTTTAVPVPIVYPDTPCQEWADEAIEGGWPADRDLLDRLLRIVWKESRCLNVSPLNPDPEIAEHFNGHDHGLVQANEIHTAWVEAMFGEPFEVAMADPVKAFRFAWLLYSGREAEGKCGWQPWSVPCS